MKKTEREELEELRQKEETRKARQKRANASKAERFYRATVTVPKNIKSIIDSYDDIESFNGYVNALILADIQARQSNV